ncbi:MAG: aspartate ammonia-lyase [Candidatus Omnitrophica bacterium]|nr:aspartate ammonia-lyase [Candidatus Omnitrophota bacterium]
MAATRLEKDLLGEKEIPAEVYWGIHTGRALENFPLCGIPAARDLIKAVCLVKKAAGAANQELGYLGSLKGQAIIQAADEIIGGKFRDQFPLDALQGGAGTSVNMNVNEVIANRAIEILGGRRGEYCRVDPLADVNLHQSTNDVFPTALKIAAIYGLRRLSESIARLQGACQEKEKEFCRVVKIGRTQTQPAVPMTLGAEFGAFAEAFGRDRWRTFKCEERLRVTNLGGTAVGTGLGAPREYIFLVIEKLREVTGLNLSRGENAVDQTANADCFVEVAGMLNAAAGNMIKIANDLRWLNGLGDIHLAAVQAGSSIMPGKVNPVACEAVMQAGMRVRANEQMISEAVSRGTLQICEFLPLVAYGLLESIELLGKAAEILRRTVLGIHKDADNCRRNWENTASIVTAFLPVIGYERAQILVQEFAASGRDSIRSFLEEKLGKATVDSVLSPENLTSLGFKK